MSRSITRTLLSGVVATLLAAAGLVAAVPASASTPAPASAYRFWGYFQQAEGKWEFAQTGPDASQPADGSVEGWRFATAGLNDTRTPRATATFDEVCSDTDAKTGNKRVAVVIDYGRTVDGDGEEEPPAPRAACALVPDTATGADVLAAVATVRAEKGLTCGIDSYPATGCGDPVDPLPEGASAADEPVQLTSAADTAADGDAAPASDTAATDDDGSNSQLWVAAGVVVLIVALGVVALRRRGSAD